MLTTEDSKQSQCAIPIPLSVWTIESTGWDMRYFTQLWTEREATGKSKLPKEVERRPYLCHVMDYFQLNRMPSGLKIVPGPFLRVMDTIMSTVHWQFVSIYLTHWCFRKCQSDTWNNANTSWRYFVMQVSLSIWRKASSSETLLSTGSYHSPRINENIATHHWHNLWLRAPN